MSEKISDDVSIEQLSPRDQELIKSDDEKEKETNDLQLKEEFLRLQESYEDLPDFVDIVKNRLISQQEKDELENPTSNYVQARRKSIFDHLEDNVESVSIDIESICRHAFAIGADNLIVLDSQARVHGLFIEKILPVIRIEYAKMNNIPLEQIKIPNIIYILSKREDFVNKDEIVEKLGPELTDKINIVFDEATDQDHKLEAGGWIGLKPEEQYKMFSYPESSDKEWNRIQSCVRTGIPSHRGGVPSCTRLATLFARTIPKGIFESHIARHSGSGGSLGWLGFRTWVGKNEDPNSNFSTLVTNDYIKRMKDRGLFKPKIVQSEKEIQQIHLDAEAFAKMELEKIGKELNINNE